MYEKGRMSMNNSKKILFLAETGILAAVIIVMAFTPLGFLHVGVISITFSVIPIVIGAIALGPLAGGILGGIFGLMSFLQCFGLDAFGTTLFGINPFYTAVMCLIPRILIGVVAAYVFRAFKNKSFVAFGVSALLGSLTNTVLFVGLLLLLFGKSDYILGLMGGGSVIAFIAAFVGINGLVEAVSNTIIGAAVAKPIYTMNTKRLG